MRIGGGGGLFEYPQGDPASLDSAANALNSAANELNSAAGDVSRQGMSLRASWCGPAAVAFESAVESVQAGLNSLAGHYQDAAAALRTYASALREAQTAADQAAQSYSDAESSYNTTTSNLASHPPTGAGATAALAQAEGQALDKLTTAFGTSSAQSNNACVDATHAAQVCAAKLTQIAADMRETALHRFLDLMGGPGTVLGGLGVVMQAKSLFAFASLVQAMKTGNWDVVAAANPKGYQSVLDVVEKYGANSPEATRAWMQYESDISAESFSGTVDAAVPTGDVPGGLAGVLDVVGKVGFVTSVVGDALTLGDSQSSGMEKTMAGVNLGGVAMAAGGLTVETAGGTTTVLAAVGAGDLIATAVPIVGEVVIAATAAYFAYDWTSNHWQDIVNWTHDAGQGISTAYHAVVDFGSQTISEGEHLVTSGLNAAGHVASSAWHDGENLVSDLNPF